MISSLWQATKINLTGKYERKLSVANISHIKFIICIRKFTTVNIVGYISYKKYELQLAYIKFQLNLWQNINEELFKVEYLIQLSQYFRNLAEAVMRLYNKIFFSKAFKVLADFNKVLNFEKFLIYVLSKFN